MKSKDGFSNSKGNRERQGRDDMDDMYSFAPYFVIPSPCFLSLTFLAARFQKHSILVISPLSLPFPFSSSASF